MCAYDYDKRNFVFFKHDKQNFAVLSTPLTILLICFEDTKRFRPLGQDKGVYSPHKTVTYFLEICSYD